MRRRSGPAHGVTAERLARPRPTAPGRSAASAPVCPTEKYGNRLGTGRFANGVTKHKPLIGKAVTML